jgi:hypothetical protein
MFRTIALTGFAALIAATTLAPAPARAQLGNIFSDPAPRPPGNVPRGQLQQQQQQDDEEEVPELPQGRILPTPNRPLPGQAAPPPGSVQSQPLAPPPGTTVIPQNAPGAVTIAPPQPSQGGVAVAPPPANPPPGPRQPKSVPGVAATLQPGDEVVTEPPSSKIVNKKASFSGLDKITGRIINFDAFVEVDEITLQGEVKRIFSGWMFAASPGLHGVEHPIYDIWLTDCKGPLQTIVSAQPDPPKPPPPPPVAAKRAPPKQAAPRPPQPFPQQQQVQEQPRPQPPPQQSTNPFFNLFRQ